MKKWAVLLSLLILTGCSAGGIQSVDEIYETKEVVEETMSKYVTVHTVVGEAPAVVIKQDERNKWVEVDLKAVSQHPTSLVESNRGKVYKAELVSYNEQTEKAYLKIKSSLKLEEQLEENETVQLVQEITYEDRLRLKEKYASTGKPSEKIAEYEKPLIFSQNPDEIEQYIWSFEQASDKSKFVSNDLLNATLEEAAESDFTYTLDSIEAINIGKTLINVAGEIKIKDAKGKETTGRITYYVTKVKGQYTLVNLQLSE